MANYYDQEINRNKMSKETDHKPPEYEIRTIHLY
jgi:hypothetical protein